MKTFPRDSGVQLVAVRNLFFGPQEKFKRWNEGKVRTRFQAAGGIELDFDELADDVFDLTFGADPQVRFSANGQSGLELGPRMELQDWFERTSAMLEAVSDRVGAGRR